MEKMKFNGIKTITAIALMLCMVLGAVGCQNGEPKETEPEKTPAQSDTDVKVDESMTESKAEVATDEEAATQPESDILTDESSTEIETDALTEEPWIDIGEPLPKDKEYHVLFIGNSYTYYNDLPSIFKAIAEVDGYNVTVDEVTKGSYTLEKFASESDDYGKRVREKLSSGVQYDFVILQEQSARPASNPGPFYTGVRLLAEMARDAGATPILYSTWGRKAGHATLSQYGWTNESMTWKLAAAYGAIGEELDISVAHVGLAFYDIYAGAKGLELYNSDKTHPSKAGSTLAALVLYAKIFNCNPLANEYFGIFSDKALETMKTAAFEAVFNTPEIPESYKTSSEGVGSN